jgi:hypothetical protein
MTTALDATSGLALLRPPLRRTLLPAVGVVVLETSLAPLNAAVAMLAFPLPLVGDRAKGLTGLSSQGVGIGVRRVRARHVGEFIPVAERCQLEGQHRRCGDLDAGVDGPIVWIACDCGGRMARRADQRDALAFKS